MLAIGSEWRSHTRQKHAQTEADQNLVQVTNSCSTGAHFSEFYAIYSFKTPRVCEAP